MSQPDRTDPTAATASDQHPHEPEIPPALDTDGCCLVCGLLVQLGEARALAEHLFQMIDPQAWRDTGGDDGQGHYEGDYRAAQVQEEIKSWTK